MVNAGEDAGRRRCPTSAPLALGLDLFEQLGFDFDVVVEEADEAVEAAGLRKNLRVRVSYLKAGGDNVIDKVTILQ